MTIKNCEVNSWLGYLNFLILQWFFIRLVKHVENGKVVKYSILKKVMPLTGWWNDYKYFKIEKFGFCVWLVNNKIIGWKIKSSHIREPLSYNTRNWYPFNNFDDFKKLNFYAPGCLHKFIFEYGHIWFKKWEHHRKFRGFRAYHEKEKK